MSYTLIESELIEYFRTYFGDYIDVPGQVTASNMDAFIDELLGEDRDFGMFIEFGGGSRPYNEQFKKYIWQWRILCAFFIRWRGDNEKIEEQLRAFLEILARTFIENPRLSGSTPLIKLQSIDAPLIQNINQVPFYWVAFELSAIDQET